MRKLIILLLLLLTLSSNAAVIYFNPYPNGYALPNYMMGSGVSMVFQLIPTNEPEYYFNYTPSAITITQSYFNASGHILGEKKGLFDYTAKRFFAGSEIYSTEYQPIRVLLQDVWYPGTNAYIGFDIVSTNADHNYGWLHIKVNDYGNITLYDWAYESEPNKSIIAGQIPEMSCLWLLGGLLFLRRVKY